MLFLVPLILLLGRFAQIAPFIIVAKTINVVYLPSRPIASHIKPSKSVGIELFSKYAHLEIFAAFRKRIGARARKTATSAL